MKYNRKAICQTANTLRKRGYTLSQAFVLAWAIAKGYNRQSSRYKQIQPSRGVTKIDNV